MSPPSPPEHSIERFIEGTLEMDTDSDGLVTAQIITVVHSIDTPAMHTIVCAPIKAAHHNLYGLLSIAFIPTTLDERTTPVVVKSVSDRVIKLYPKKEEKKQ